VLTPLFGGASEAEVASIVRAALDRAKAAGADVFDVTVPDLDQLLQGTSVIATQFKFELFDFLAAYPAAPLRSLDEILRGGLYASNVQAVYQRANHEAHGDRLLLGDAACGHRDDRDFLLQRAAFLRRSTARVPDDSSMNGLPPRWRHTGTLARRGGKELFYIAMDGRLMAVPGSSRVLWTIDGRPRSGHRG
jgi:hypothetical protein